MSRLARIAVLIVAAALLAVPLDGTGFAQSEFNAAAKGQRLDELFGRLKAVNDEREGEGPSPRSGSCGSSPAGPRSTSRWSGADLT